MYYYNKLLFFLYFFIILFFLIKEKMNATERKLVSKDILIEQNNNFINAYHGANPVYRKFQSSLLQRIVKIKK